MPFRDVLGQERAADILRQAMAAGRVAHAYLFRGPDGVGKTRMAVQFAAAMLCAEGKGDACGRCRNCVRIAHGNHPDVDLIEHAEGKRFFAIEDIRHLIEALHLTAVESAWKVVIIRDAERLRDDAQNTLLKTLEEPPPGRLIILVSARPDRLVPTILSRCHQVRFQPLARPTMTALLQREPGLSAEDVRFAVACAGGSMGRATDLLRSGAAATREQVLPRMEQLRLGQALALAEELNTTFGDTEKELEGKREGARLLLELVTSFFRDVAVLAEGGAEDALYHPDRADLSRRLAQRYGGEAALQIVETLWQARDAIEHNANIRLTLENTLFTIAEIQAVAGKAA